MDLSKKAIEAVPHPVAGQKFVWFDTPRGFGLRVTPTTKTFIFDARVNGKKRRVTIGRVDVFTDLKRARAEATRQADAFNRGVDPAAEKVRLKEASVRERAEALTLKDAIKRYADAPKKKGSGYGSGVKLKKARTIRDIHTVTNRHFGDWMDKTVTSITGGMVKERHAEIAVDAATQANLAMRYLRAALNHVNDESEGDTPLIVSNPVDRLKRLNQWADTKPKKGRLERDDIPVWVSAVRTELVGLKHGAEHKDALLFILLTGARLAEVFGNDQDGYPALRWSDVDLKRRTVTFRDTKNRTDHETALGTELTKTLASRNEVSSGHYVFGDKDDKVSSDLRTAFARIQQASGLRVTAHDLRRTFAAVANTLDISAYKLKRLLNHISGNTSDVTAGYIGEITTDDLREPMQRIEDFMLRAVKA
ncbi:tyrosine-type recombinase/integrase [Pseudosulfitobacter koreensis]|uniref:Integrase family protein n=1 Tax=Pseudosulfitobacter koreensis TaxID=2968472 RepID=A0ABT1Z3B0_9RHOB|nr:integrase family protein [Pseudosulfitobacter koreense]MCR8827615.1 integrase family protein [Pseudosulfitobacter koreense]